MLVAAHLPASHSTRSLVCSLLTPTGRITLSGASLITTEGDERHEQDLEQDELLAVYRDSFGVVLERLPVQPAAPEESN